MNKEIQIFKNEEFGQVRTMLINNEPWFVGKDVANILGYVKPLNAIATHVDEEDSLKQGLIDSAGRTQQTIVINESGLYSLILSSKLPNAKKFKRWVTREVLPSIRKTGSYSSKKKVDPAIKEKEIEARLKNAKAREANVLLKIASNPNLSEEYVQVLQSKATEIITGEAILPLPIAERKTYSAEEIGKQLGISGNKVGRMANKYNLKTDEYGKYYHDKSKYSSKEVESFRYYDSIIPVLRKLLELEG